MATSTMNIELSETLGPNQNGNSVPHVEETIKAKNWLLLIINCALVFCGVIGCPLLMRLYYLHGGSRKWLTASLEAAGFPVLIFPLIFLYIKSKSSTQNNDQSASFCMEPKLFLWSAIVGIGYGVAHFMYAWGFSYLPVSTSTILSATQLCFTAFFAWLIVKQKITAFIINAVVIMTLGSVLLGINTDGDRPIGVSKAQYLLGFLLTLAASVLCGFMMPLIELAYSKATRNITYATLLQFQITLSLFATGLDVIGMLINKDFQAIHREADEFGLGKSKYYMILIFTALTSQLASVGFLGVILYTNALFIGIYGSVLLPFIEVAGVIFFHESFTGLKGMALALCLWGFSSYFYGEYKMMKKAGNNKSAVEKIDEKVENEPKRSDDQEAPYNNTV
uniref:Probable purine permease n=1 Tax=Papaver somniferum TaxID=3469 RepID=A0A5B7LKA1_PAPSO|nr:pup6-like [Papaver somniferum]